ncbi:MAG: phosphate/phosphite/phosphonate ABC transporter substrate-binding protein [Myxococcota bacterium]
MVRRLLVLAPLLAALGVVDARAASSAYRVGVVPQLDTAKTAAIWKPVLAEVTRRTGVQLVLDTSADIPAFEQELAAGKFDFAYMNPYHFLLAKRDNGYVPLVRDEGTKLQGILVVRKDSTVAKPEDLAGQKIAFPAPNALAASLLIRAALVRDKATAFEAIYLGNHTEAYEAVVAERVAAAGGVQRTLDEQPAAVRDQLHVIFETVPVASHPFATHPRVPAADREKVSQALLGMASQPSTQALLAAVPFKKIVPASVDDYRQLMRWGLQDFYIAPK